MSSPDAAILNAIGTDILELTVCVAVETVFISNTKFLIIYRTDKNAILAVYSILVIKAFTILLRL